MHLCEAAQAEISDCTLNPSNFFFAGDAMDLGLEVMKGRKYCDTQSG